MKRVLLTVLGTLFLTVWAGAVAFADCMGPNPTPGERPEWAGEQQCDELVQLVAQDDLFPAQGPAIGADNENGQGEQGRTRDPSTHGE